MTRRVPPGGPAALVRLFSVVDRRFPHRRRRSWSPVTSPENQRRKRRRRWHPDLPPRMLSVVVAPLSQMGWSRSANAGPGRPGRHPSAKPRRTPAATVAGLTGSLGGPIQFPQIRAPASSPSARRLDWQRPPPRTAAVPSRFPGSRSACAAPSSGTRRRTSPNHPHHLRPRRSGRCSPGTVFCSPRRWCCSGGRSRESGGRGASTDPDARVVFAWHDVLYAGASPPGVSGAAITRAPLHDLDNRP